MLGSEANHITHCSLVLTALTDMRWHITQSHGQVAPVPGILANRCCHLRVRTPDPLVNLLLNRHGFQPRMLKTHVTLEERAEVCSGSGSDPQQDLTALPPSIATHLKRVRQTVGSKTRFSHSGFIHIHTTVKALKYDHRSSDCSYRRHCIDQIHYL